MSWWSEMIGDLVLDENLQTAFVLVIAVPLSIVMAMIGQLLKKIPAVFLQKESVPEILTALGLVLGFVAAYALDLPKPITMMTGTLAGAMANRAYDYTRSGPIMKKVGPTGASPIQ